MTNAPRFLILDLNRHAAETLRGMLEQAGKKARVVYDESELIDLNIAYKSEIVFLDRNFPKVGGMELVDYLRINAPEAKLVGLTDQPDAKLTRFLKQKGIGDILAKPYSKKDVRATLQRMTLGHGDSRFDFINMIGRSPAMRALYETIRQVALTDSSVLINGETGSGKELVASAIHGLSRRRNMRFVTINCGALPESLLESELFGHEKGAFTGAIKAKAGKFEYADGGTLFLDEIGEVSPNTQMKLLKVIETGQVERLGSNRVINTNTRMLFATNRDLSADTLSGKFRRDLFYRINVFPINAPPLRDRVEDIPVLADHFLRVYRSRHERSVTGIAPGAMGWLIKQKWEGNVRELENTIERAVIVATGGVIDQGDFIEKQDGGIDSEVNGLSGISYREMTRRVMGVYEKKYFERLLTDCKGNLSGAARKAGLDRKTMYGRLKKLDIDPSQFRKRSNE